MAEARFNENGVLINSETGEPIGMRNGNTITINSNGSEAKTLDDYGVLLPDFPDEEENGRKDEDGDFANFKSVGVRSHSEVKTDAESDSSITSHIDNGITSYQVKRTKYEVTKDSYFVIKFGLIQQDDGRFVPINEKSIDDFSESERHWVKFRMWNYDEELKWKSESLEYDNNMKTQLINQDKLNEKKIKYLMLDWSFGEYEDRLKLLHCDGRLSDESYGIIKGMYPSIVVTIINLMNAVLESNQ